MSDGGTGDGVGTPAPGPDEGSLLASAGSETGDPGSGEDRKTGAPDEGVPDSYSFTPQEGWEIDKESLGGFEKLARESGLTQKQFEAVTQHGLEYFQNMLGKQAEQFNARQTQWQNTALQDKELSDGTKLRPEVMTNVGHVFEQFGGDDLRKALNETGAGNHPQIIKTLNAIGKALGAAAPPDQGKGTAAPKDGNVFSQIAREMYPNEDK